MDPYEGIGIGPISGSLKYDPDLHSTKTLYENILQAQLSGSCSLTTDDVTYCMSKAEIRQFVP